MNKLTKFETACNAVSEKLGIDVMFFDDETGSSVVEDDGNLHITRRGKRACFDVGNGQSLNGKQQNERAKKILAELGIEATKDALVDETDDEDDENTCSCCGHPL